MTIYVDDMLQLAQVGRGRPAKWSHLMADSHAELEAFARRLGLQSEWIQNEGTHREHYDVTATVREQALQLGATGITYPWGMAELIDTRRAVCKCKTLPSCCWSTFAELL